MSVQNAGVAKGLDRGLSFPSNALSEVPFRVYTDPEQYRLEQEQIFKGPTWSYLCLTAEIPEPGDWVATTVGEVAVVVARGPDGEINAFVNRCAHRGNLLCLTEKGHGKEITCIYHGWTYDLAGKLTGVAFERGIKRQGGMPPEFRKDEHNLGGCGAPSSPVSASARSATTRPGSKRIWGRRSPAGSAAC